MEKVFWQSLKREDKGSHRVSTIAIRASRFLLEHFLQVLCSEALEKERRAREKPSVEKRDFRTVIHAI